MNRIWLAAGAGDGQGGTFTGSVTTARSRRRWPHSPSGSTRPAAAGGSPGHATLTAPAASLSTLSSLNPQTELTGDLRPLTGKFNTKSQHQQQPRRRLGRAGPPAASAGPASPSSPAWQGCRCGRQSGGGEAARNDGKSPGKLVWSHRGHRSLIGHVSNVRRSLGQRLPQDDLEVLVCRTL